MPGVDIKGRANSTSDSSSALSLLARSIKFPDAKLNVIVRAKGGASLHSWNFDISVKCADKDRPLTPLTHDVPNDVVANVFSNVSTIEIAEPADPTYRGVSVQRCNVG